MNVAIGFDPGGIHKFGWAVVEVDGTPPFRVRGAGTASHAKAALAAALAAAHGSTVLAVGVDAPMYWSPTGSRAADAFLRSLIGPPSGTVQEPNSLRGACVVQGPIIAALTREALASDTPISEAHPKAFLRLIALSSQEITTWLKNSPGNEDERDAALGAVAAWAGIASPVGWEDLRTLEGEGLLQPFPGPPARYFMPTNGRVAAQRREK